MSITLSCLIHIFFNDCNESLSAIEQLVRAFQFQHANIVPLITVSCHDRQQCEPNCQQSFPFYFPSRITVVMHHRCHHYWQNVCSRHIRAYWKGNGICIYIWICIIIKCIVYAYHFVLSDFSISIALTNSKY